MNDYVSLILGIVCAGIGGELFVRGVVGLSRRARISPALAGATLAAMATSSPELTVSVNAALEGVPRIALGDALGSNVVNVALVLGVALAISAIQSPRDSVKRDFPVALLAPVLTAALLFDGTLSRGDALTMLGLFIAWLILVVIDARKQRSEAGEGAEEQRGWVAGLQSLGGLALLVAAGRLIVTGARGIASSFGVDEFVIGATIVAVGTGAPEIATALVSKLRGHDEVGLGTILGSNLYNGLLVVPIAALIAPISVDWNEVAVALGFGLLAVALVFPGRSGFIHRWRSFLLLALYAAYTVLIIQRRAD
jgi:cation:H+ antiporter